MQAGESRYLLRRADVLRLGVIVEPLVHRSEGVRRQHVLLRAHALPVSPAQAARSPAAAGGKEGWRGEESVGGGA